jgi:hypothetical protein
MMTGSEFFPGGLGEFIAKKNEFLVFEEGPSVDVVLQWATYRDASDQTSLSRIWGGIHPPADDIPGRFIGQEVAEDTFDFAVPYFNSSLGTQDSYLSNVSIYPNPTSGKVNIVNLNNIDLIEVYDVRGRNVQFETIYFNSGQQLFKISINADPGIFFLKIGNFTHKIILQ